MPQRSLHTPLGALTVFECDERIVALETGWGDGQSRTPLLDETVAQLQAYFDGTRRSFDLPLAPAGTAYRQRVWSALSAIPYGSTLTYGELAARVGGVARSIGQALGANPLPVLIPCHRVVAATGPGGFSMAGGLTSKRLLLDLEASEITTRLV